MKYKVTSLCVVLTVSFFCYPMERDIDSGAPADCTSKDVFIDLVGVMFEPSKKAAVQQMGAVGVAAAASAWGRSLFSSKKFDPQEEFFNFLKAGTARVQRDPQSVVVWDGHELPDQLYQFHLAKTVEEQQQIRASVQTLIAEKKPSSAVLFSVLANMTFDAEKRGDLFCEVSKGVALATRLRELGHTLHYCANFNQAELDVLQKKFPQTLALFNGVQIIAGSTGQLRHPSHYFKIEGLDDSQPVAIETQEAFSQGLYATAQEWGVPFSTTLCRNQDFGYVETELVRCGALPQKKS